MFSYTRVYASLNIIMIIFSYKDKLLSSLVSLKTATRMATAMSKQPFSFCSDTACKLFILNVFYEAALTTHHLPSIKVRKITLVTKSSKVWMNYFFSKENLTNRFWQTSKKYNNYVLVNSNQFVAVGSTIELVCFPRSDKDTLGFWDLSRRINFL